MSITRANRPMGMFFAVVIFAAYGLESSADQKPEDGTRLAEASQSAVIRADVRGETSISPHGFRREWIDFPEETIKELLSVREKGVLEVLDWPVAPGTRETVRFKVIQVYAPESRVWVIDGASKHQIPRSARIHLLGDSEIDPTLRVVLSVDPQTGTLRGSVTHSDREYRYLEYDVANSKRSQIAELEDLVQEGNAGLTFGCGFDEIPWRDQIDQTAIDRGGVSSVSKASTLRQIVVAVDTDTEFNSLKFSDNETAAEDWIADLFAEMTTLYERDLSLRVLKGDTFLRHGSDPYSVTGSPADTPHLSEFRNYWSANMGHVNRVFAMLLSGKSTSTTSSSGIAYLDGYCENQSGGYSVSQVFLESWIPVTSDLRVVAHELGHNLGSPHTHCYSPPVDICFACENGCYSGTVSCPSGGQGTLMSYCHYFDQDHPSCTANCGSNAAALHSRVIALMDGYVTAHTPSCVTLVNDTGIFEDDFEDGHTNNWSSKVP